MLIILSATPTAEECELWKAEESDFYRALADQKFAEAEAIIATSEPGSWDRITAEELEEEGEEFLHKANCLMNEVTAEEILHKNGA